MGNAFASAERIEIVSGIHEYNNATECRHASKKLGGTIYDAIGELKKLVTLDLCNNALTGSIPCSIVGLVNLRVLGLASNRLSGAIPDAICNMKNLTDIALHKNKLRGPIPASIDRLANLQTFRVSFNQLSGDIPISLCRLRRLETLYLSENELTGKIPADIGSLVNLKDFRAAYNKLSGEIPDSVGELRKVEVFWLHNNQLTGKIPSTIDGLIRVMDLRISYNQLSGEIPKAICNLRSVRELSLCDNMLTGCIPIEFSKLANVNLINLSNNQLTGRVEGQFNGCKTLDFLDVSCNGLTDFQAMWMLTKPRFSLNVAGNRFAAQNLGGVEYTEGCVKKQGTYAMTSFCGVEWVSWLQMLDRWSSERISQCCVFLKDYANVDKVDLEVKAREWHVDCEDNAVYFNRAGDAAIASHQMFGCAWFHKWRKNIDRALESNHNVFVIVTKLDWTLGVCQTVELEYLKAKCAGRNIRLVMATVDLACHGNVGLSLTTDTHLSVASKFFSQYLLYDTWPARVNDDQAYWLEWAKARVKTLVL